MFLLVVLAVFGFLFFFFFFFKQKTAYEMRISDWSSDVCSSDLTGAGVSNMGRSLIPPICRALGRMALWRPCSPHMKRPIGRWPRHAWERAALVAPTPGAPCWTTMCLWLLDRMHQWNRPIPLLALLRR